MQTFLTCLEVGGPGRANGWPELNEPFFHLHHRGHKSLLLVGGGGVPGQFGPGRPGMSRFSFCLTLTLTLHHWGTQKPSIVQVYLDKLAQVDLGQFPFVFYKKSNQNKVGLNMFLTVLRVRDASSWAESNWIIA